MNDNIDMGRGITNSCGEMHSCDCTRDSNLKELVDYIPEDLFPEEAVVKDRYNKYLRHTEWEYIENVNERRKKIADEYLEFFRKEHLNDNRSNEDILFDDEIWIEYGLYDSLLYDALEHGDYILDNCKKGDVTFERKDLLKYMQQWDVIIDCTIVGRVCHPYVVFGIQRQRNFAAKDIYDDYASDEMHKLQKWRQTIHDRDTSSDYRNMEIKLFKEGHIHFELQEYPVEYRHVIRWVDHKDNNIKTKVHKNIW